VITLLTGIPGAGKTLLSVTELAKEYEGRDIYYYNIPELKLPWSHLDDPSNWQELPQNSVIFIHEAHEVCPLR